jgi:RNA polymerase sigma factor (sigma-70 family)
VGGLSDADQEQGTMDYTQLNHQELIQYLCQGDPLAEQEFDRRYRNPLNGFFRRQGRQPADAEDAVQQTLFRTFRYLGNYDPARGNLDQFVYTIAKSVQQDTHRRERSQMRLMLPPTGGDTPAWIDQARSRESDSFNRVVSQELSQNVMLALAELPPQRRLPFLLSYGRGIKQREVASRLGLDYRDMVNHMHADVRHVLSWLVQRGHVDNLISNEAGRQLIALACDTIVSTVQDGLSQLPPAELDAFRHCLAGGSTLEAVATLVGQALEDLYDGMRRVVRRLRQYLQEVRYRLLAVRERWQDLWLFIQAALQTP